MFHPTPRVDRWEPWIAIGVLGTLAFVATLYHLLM